MMQTAEKSRLMPNPNKFVRIDHKKVASVTTPPSPSAWKAAWQRLTANKWAMAGLYVLIGVVIMAIIGPMITEYNYYSNNLDHTNEAPSSEHWFGTDKLGRDVFARTWVGARISLTVGIVAALGDLLIGVIIGVIMGYFGGKTDEILNKASEILYAIPYLLVVILLSVVFGSSMRTIIMALVATGWISMAWIVRGQMMQLKNQEYVLAARSMGASGFRILFRHLIPNSLGPILVTVTLTVPTAIFTEAFLSFLGLGVQAPAASWGVMIDDALSSWQLYPWQMLFPAGLLCISMLAFNIFGDGLRDAFDPKSNTF